MARAPHNSYVQVTFSTGTPFGQDHNFRVARNAATTSKTGAVVILNISRAIATNLDFVKKKQKQTRRWEGREPF